MLSELCPMADSENTFKGFLPYATGDGHKLGVLGRCCHAGHQASRTDDLLPAGRVHHGHLALRAELR